MQRRGIASLATSVLTVAGIAEGAPAPTWVTGVGSPGIGGVVYALAVFDDGMGGGPALYAGGQFTSAGGAGASNLARWDGVSWSPVGSGVNGSVHALCVFDEDGPGPQRPALIIGGNFTMTGASAASRLARWDGVTIEEHAGGVVSSAQHPLFAPAVAALCAFDPDGPGGAPAGLAVGGEFTTGGATPALNLAIWRGGAWHEIGGGIEHNVNALIVHDDGSGEALFVGGSVLWLGGFGGTIADYIARWGAQGWDTLAGGLNAQPLAFARLPGDSRLYMTGNFGASTSGVNMHGVGAWNSGAWQGMANGLPIIGKSLAVYDLGFGEGRRLFAGGHFAMHRWTGAAWLPPPSGITGGPWNVHAMRVYDDGRGDGPTLYIAGEFGGVGANIAALRGAPYCPGDATGDRVVNFADLNGVLTEFGRASTTPGGLLGDVNYDGVVNFTDLNIVLGSFGEAC